ncbi:MAG: PEP-CTERM sorting domain-containing protein [Planctomycetota bacterium]|nr:MAG: PEP-CTERM sorting domain-containing protein [Planctomycetota bacterium]
MAGKRLMLGLSAVLLGVHTAAAATVFYGPTPYLSEADNPFLSLPGTFYLETFEDGLLNTPGLSAINGSVREPSGLTDSVDGDDGVIDGSGNAGHNYFVRPGSTGVTFVFSPDPFGKLPNYAGLVATDGYGQNGAPANTVEFYGPGDELLGTLSNPYQDFNVDTTDDDRFMGIYHSEGVSKMRIFNLGTGSTTMESDHITYGVPEPSSLALLASGGLIGLGAWLRRRVAPKTC